MVDEAVYVGFVIGKLLLMAAYALIVSRLPAARERFPLSFCRAGLISLAPVMTDNQPVSAAAGSGRCCSGKVHNTSGRGQRGEARQLTA
jgi:hypothetical protein